ncbi:MAG: hypothetical protein HGA47_01750 [Zoogloea sp.]|nr:hypothetical protein [Zoogloea sp.]
MTMTTKRARDFFACLDEQDSGADQAHAVRFEPVGDQATQLDVAAEIAAFVERPDPVVIEAVPIMVGGTRNFESCGSRTRATPFSDAAGFYESGRL